MVVATQKYIVRQFSAVDVPKVVELLNVVFKPDGLFSSQWWNWKYKSNPAGGVEDGNIWVAEAGQKIVGYYAIMPERVKVGAETRICAQSVDTAVHPDFRGLGIFSKLAKNVCSAAADRYEFAFGFPSRMAYEGFLKMGWRSFLVDEYIKILDHEQLLKSLKNNALARRLGKTALRTLGLIHHTSIKACDSKTSLEVQKVGVFPREIDTFWQTARFENEIVIERNFDFLNWRFSKFFGNYQVFLGRCLETGVIRGYAVFKETKIPNFENVLEIVDLWALAGTEGFISNMIKHAIENGIRENMSMIHCRIPSWHRHSRIMRKFGFFKANGYLRLLRMYRPRAIYYGFGDMRPLPDPKLWFYTMADTDFA